MGFLENTKKTIAFVSASQNIINQYEKITSTEDFLNVEIYEKLEKYNNKLKDLLDKNPEMQSIEAITSLLFCYEDAKYIKEFSSKNYEKSFQIAKDILNNNHFGILALNTGISHALNSLMELKANLTNEEFKNKFSEEEIIFKSQANFYFSNPTKNKEGLITLEYNGNKVSLAYGAFLDGNKEEMQLYMNEQIHRFGIEKVLEMELGNRCPWFYNTVHPKYTEFLNETLNPTIPNKIKKLKK